MQASLTDDSRKVSPGSVFVAVKGISHDGHDFIPEAIKKGAIKIYGEKRLNYPNYIRVKDSRQKLGELASEYYKNPSHKLTVIGVTGTKGKTTTCHIIHHILNHLGQKTGLISSITVPGHHVTTPATMDFHRMLKEMVDGGDKFAVVEVSSHGIDQGRIAGVKFAATVLTNIAPEHLDYHKSFEEYKKVKTNFLKLAPIRVIAKKDTALSVLPGKFNNLNAEAALEVVVALGFDRQKAMEALKSFKLPEGRLQEVKNSLGVKVIIDFAHTPDSLAVVLGYLKEVTKGRLISVFGCAAERDSGKRPKMGKISTQNADLSVFTAEDPRNEDIYFILEQIESGAVNKNYISIPERGEAIAFALSQARKGDCVGIFGKGHEKSMSYKGFEHPWSDEKVVKSLMNPQVEISAIILAAGMGTRMNSNIPKVLMEICGRPMLSYTLEHLRDVGIIDAVVVVGFKKEEVVERFAGAVKFAVQKMPKGGTADAARAGMPFVSEKSDILMVVNGDDSAFYKPETIKGVLKSHKESGANLTFVSLIKENPLGLGRVARDKDGKLSGIIEEKNATETQRLIKEINSGLYVFDKKWFARNIGKVEKSPQGEYYLVDLVKIAVDEGEKVNVFTLPDDSQWQGINTPDQLIEAQKKMEKRLNGKV